MKALIGLVVFAGALAAQTVEGDVVDATTGAPLAGVRVGLPGNGMERYTVLTDAAGHFHFSVAVPPYATLLVVHPGYILQQRAQALPGQAPASHLHVSLMPQGVIWGRLEDEDGFPVEGAVVAALRYRIMNGRSELYAMQPTSQTNDLGEFRLPQLPAGRYYLCAMSGSMLTVWDRQYTGECPSGAPDASRAIEVKAGQEVNASTVRLTRHAGVTVTGRVAIPAGRRITRMPSVFLQANEPYRFALSILGAVQRDGTFTVRHVPPGNYTARFNTGNTTPPAAGDVYAARAIHVGENDVRDVELAAREIQPVTVTGKVVGDDGPAAGIAIGLRSSSGQVIAGTSGEDGVVQFKDLLPGQYSVTADWQRAQRLVWVEWNGQRVRGTSFEFDGTGGSVTIRLSSKLTGLYGEVLDASGGVVANAAVLIVGEAGRELLETNASGWFATSWLGAGEYRVYVVGDVEKASVLEDSEYLRAHAADLAGVRLAAGETLAVTVRVK